MPYTPDTVLEAGDIVLKKDKEPLPLQSLHLSGWVEAGNEQIQQVNNADSILVGVTCY